jgi:hypothetical protein
MSLWLPILVSAVFVFIASSIIHMFLPYHRTDWSKIPSEDGVMDALRPFNIPPGEYIVPHSGGGTEMKSPEFQEKVKKGPVAFMTVLPNAMPEMTASLIQWFVYCIVISIFAAYIASRAVDPGDPYLTVFRFVGATAFIAYTVAGWQQSIWYKRAWSTSIKNTFDGLVYAVLTAGTFGWMWPS